jgi:archaetidylinositol phosphate synthase
MHVWRERLERWFSPLARRCVLSPNTITILALLLNLVAAALLALGGRIPLLFIGGMVLLIVAGFADAFDGIVARLQNKQTRYGDFLDHSADRLSDVSLAIGWMIGSGVRSPLIIACVVVIMLNGYIGTQIEATWRERNYATLGRGEFVLALVVFPIVSYILASNGWRDVGAFGFTVAECLTFLMIVFALLGIGQRFALAARLERTE